jgi:hypothetical protein
MSIQHPHTLQQSSDATTAVEPITGTGIQPNSPTSDAATATATTATTGTAATPTTPTAVIVPPLTPSVATDDVNVATVDTPVPPPTEEETRLAEEVRSAWAAFSVTRGVAKETRQQLRERAAKLGELLFQLKSELSRTGRGGRWAGYLKQEHRSRTTADRYIAKYEKSLQPVVKRTTGALPEPSDAVVDAFVAKLLPRLNRFCTTKQAAYRLMEGMAAGLDLVESDETANGFIVISPSATA